MNLYLHCFNRHISKPGLVGSDPPVLAVSPVPVPAAVWLFGAGLIRLFGAARIKRLV